jgi:capsular exopolysaccharide synthesis family protein
MLERQEREPRNPEQSVNPDAPSFSAVAEGEFDLNSTPQSIETLREPVPTLVGGDALDLSKVERRPWAPVFAKIPALLERGPSVEQFRSLRSRIYELRGISPLKSILVTSGMPQEGKSFVSTNLAFSLARHKNSRVLLIDGDMRRYTLHQTLGCESQPGLADYLAGKVSIVEAMQRPEQSTDANLRQSLPPNITFIASGNGGDKAADLSGNPRFGELIRQAAPHFDWIIVDSSPVLPVSDGVNLARACDGVLLVAREGVTKFPVAQRAQSELKASNVLGFVLNAVHEMPQVGNYYGYDATKE